MKNNTGFLLPQGRIIYMQFPPPVSPKGEEDCEGEVWRELLDAVTILLATSIPASALVVQTEPEPLLKPPSTLVMEIDDIVSEDVEDHLPGLSLRGWGLSQCPLLTRMSGLSWSGIRPAQTTRLATLCLRPWTGIWPPVQRTTKGKYPVALVVCQILNSLALRSTKYFILPWLLPRSSSGTRFWCWWESCNPWETPWADPYIVVRMSTRTCWCQYRPAGCTCHQSLP